MARHPETTDPALAQAVHSRNRRRLISMAFSYLGQPTMLSWRRRAWKRGAALEQRTRRVNSVDNMDEIDNMNRINGAK
jgi:hypothetical protein